MSDFFDNFLIIGFIGFCCYGLEIVVHSVIRSHSIQYLSLSRERQLEYLSRLFEVIGSCYIALMRPLIVILAFFNVLTEDVAWLCRTQLLMMAGYFSYHLLRIQELPRAPKLLWLHHLIYILLIILALLVNKYHEYLLIGGLASATAVVRNLGWYNDHGYLNKILLDIHTRNYLYIIFEIFPLIMVWGTLF